MSKKITDENGNTYVQKKPFYKRIWFIILVVVVVLVAFGSSMGGDKATKVSSGTGNSSKSKGISNETFKVGDTAEYKGVQYKVNSVNFSDGDDINKPDSGKKYVTVNITITNKGDDKVSYNPLDFKLDDNGNQTSLDEMMGENNVLNSGDLAKGATVTGNLTGQANPDNKLKLIYSGNMFSDKEHVTFNLN